MLADISFHVPDCILFFFTPATDLFLDIVHVNSGEQIRGSVKIFNFRLTKKN